MMHNKNVLGELPDTIRYETAARRRDEGHVELNRARERSYSTYIPHGTLIVIQWLNVVIVHFLLFFLRLSFSSLAWRFREKVSMSYHAKCDSRFS